MQNETLGIFFFLSPKSKQLTKLSSCILSCSREMIEIFLVPHYLLGQLWL